MDFDFPVGAPAPVLVRVNGTEYKLPRFLLPQMKEDIARQKKEQMDAALAQISDEQRKAQFALYYAPAPVDVLAVIQQNRTPDGIERLLRWSAGEAGMPGAVVDAWIANGDPVRLRNLAEEIGSAAAAEVQLKQESGEGADAGPLTSPPVA